MIEHEPIGYVPAVRPHLEADLWGSEQSCISLVEGFGPEAVQGLASGRSSRSVAKIDPTGLAARFAVCYV